MLIICYSKICLTGLKVNEYCNLISLWLKNPKIQWIGNGGETQHQF